MREAVTFNHPRDGETFLLRGWPSTSPSKTLLVMHHGLGEHSGRYARFVQHLSDLPVHLWSFDVRGHGQSTGKRGDADGLAQLADDFDALLPALMERSGAERAIVLGHSLGGASVGWWLTSRELPSYVHAVALSAPLIKVPQTLAVRVKTRLGRTFGGLAPRLTLNNGLDARGISSDASEVARYREDPHNHDRLSVRLGLSIQRDGPEIVRRAGRLQLPLLLWHGLDDPIVDIAGSRELFAAWGGADKALVELPGYRHESHHESPERAASLFERLRAWLQPRVQGAS